VFEENEFSTAEHSGGREGRRSSARPLISHLPTHLLTVRGQSVRKVGGFAGLLAPSGKGKRAGARLKRRAAGGVLTRSSRHSKAALGAPLLARTPPAAASPPLSSPNVLSFLAAAKAGQRRSFPLTPSAAPAVKRRTASKRCNRLPAYPPSLAPELPQRHCMSVGRGIGSNVVDRWDGDRWVARGR
jgi:hypothetical protein